MQTDGAINTKKNCNRLSKRDLKVDQALLDNWR